MQKDRRKGRRCRTDRLSEPVRLAGETEPADPVRRPVSAIKILSPPRARSQVQAGPIAPRHSGGFSWSRFANRVPKPGQARWGNSRTGSKGRTRNSQYIMGAYPGGPPEPAGAAVSTVNRGGREKFPFLGKGLLYNHPLAWGSAGEKVFFLFLKLGEVDACVPPGSPRRRELGPGRRQPKSAPPPMGGTGRGRLPPRSAGGPSGREDRIRKAPGAS